MPDELPGTSIQANATQRAIQLNESCHGCCEPDSAELLLTEDASRLSMQVVPAGLSRKDYNPISRQCIQCLLEGIMTIFDPFCSFLRQFPSSSPIPTPRITVPDDASPDDIQSVSLNEIQSSGRFTAEQRRQEYRRRGKSPSGVIDGVYNDEYRGNEGYNDTLRDWDADA
jgi:hypothetical protein